jgi:hypothetical protein
MHHSKLSNVTALSSEARYAYFVRKVADCSVVWSLFSEGWATLQSEGGLAIPFWPEPGFAQVCATGLWNDLNTTHIGLDEFLYHWLPGMEGDHHLCAVFPTSSDGGLLVKPKELIRDIRRELEQYE